MLPTDLHSRSPEACPEALDARPEGPSSAEAAGRLAEHGPNRLPEKRGRGPAMRFLAHFNNVLIHVLLMAAVVAASLHHWVDTGAILAVVLANAAIGYLQEGRAESAMAAIRDRLAPRAAALCYGARVTLDGADLVPGDKVPADLRLLEARGLAAQEAILTGEPCRSRRPSIRWLSMPRWGIDGRCCGRARWSPRARRAALWWRPDPRPRSGVSAACWKGSPN